MSAMTLLIDHRETRLTLEGNGVVCVRHDDQPPARVGLHALQRIIVAGDVPLSSRLLRACAETGVGLVLLPGRGPREAIHLFPAPATALSLRHAQHCGFADSGRRLALARAVVRAKIEQQQLWLEAQDARADLRRFRDEAGQAADLNGLLGVEGAASARYFAAWAKLWQEPWRFPGRNRRPPRDPLNALLSLGYTLALHHVGRLAAQRGLDLGFGFLHAPRAGRPALALDLLEPVRPWVDQWVWQLLNSRKALAPAHFTISPAEGCRLDQEGRGLFYAAWHQDEERWLHTSARRGLAVVLNALRPTLGTRRGDFVEEGHFP